MANGADRPTIDGQNFIKVEGIGLTLELTLELYGQTYGGEAPQMIEGDVFRIIVKVPEFGSVADQITEEGSGSPQVEAQVGDQVGTRLKYCETA